MKKKNLFVAALAALTFASCSTDDNRMGGNAPDGTAMHAQLSIRFDENTTRATDAGNASEGISTGAKLNVIVYKNDVVENIKTFDLAATETTTASFPTTAGPKKVVVIANLPADLVASLPSVNDPISNLYALQADLVTAEIDKIDTENKFTMSGIEETTFTVTEGAGDDETTPLNVPVTISRLAAKINLGIADLIPRTGILAADKANVDFVKVGNTSGGAKPPHFALQLTHKYANILPETKDAFTEAGTAVGGPPAESYGDIVTTNPLVYKTATIDFTTVAYGSSNYCPANYNENPETRNSTMAAIRLQLKPEKEMVVTSNSPDAGYTTTYATATFTNGDFYGFVYKGVTYAPFSTSANATAAYAVINGAATPAVSVETWTTGLAYYKIYVGDRTSGVATKYSVLANRVYEINVSSISGFGSSDEGGIIDPPGPIEKDAHITATITVADWDLVEFSEGIQ